MVRTTLTSNTQTVFFDIPNDYVGKELEVIVFAKNEGVQNVELKNKHTSFSAVSLDTQNFKFDRTEANER
jgi:hypothetical protein